MTIFFVMLAEVFIYAPSIARYRKVYLEDRLSDAHLATLALEASPDNMIGQGLKTQLLDHARAYGVVTDRGNASRLMLMREMPPTVDKTIDLREGSFFGFIVEAFHTLVQGENRILRVMGMSPKDPQVLIEVVLDEWPMREEMFDYSERILILSIIISLMTAALVYLSLQWLMVRPMRLLTQSMMSFRENPEDEHRIMKAGRRSDEIGVAERELSDMQIGLRAALNQKARLAALGTGVTKIHHDLRNILSTARLVSDRLTALDDPEVKRITPLLMRAIDRAVSLCSQTLNYARSDTVAPRLARLSLKDVVDEVAASLSQEEGVETARLENAVGETLEITADRDQLFRVLSNLSKNAAQAGAQTIRVSALRAGGAVCIDVEDDGPGLPEKAQGNLFKPFTGSARPNGTGLGLAIARELMQIHGGDIVLERTSSTGTLFRLTMPDEAPTASTSHSRL